MSRMTKGMGLLAVVVAMWVAGCSTAAPPAGSRVPNDPPDSVEAVLHRWYAAIAQHDSAGIAAPLAPEFFLFEDTSLVSRERLVAGLMSGAGQGSQTVDLRDFRTVVRDSVAWTSLHNHEEWIPVKGEPMAFDFLETVVFVKRDGRWLMERYHATRIEHGK